MGQRGVPPRPAAGVPRRPTRRGGPGGAVTLGDLHDAARAVLDPVHYDYVAGGAGEERALAANGRAFDRYALLPRVLRGAAR
ncbi:alpha-hydroxy-acid oxidizing protein, partial [Streptomyces ardesiacus]